MKSLVSKKTIMKSQQEHKVIHFRSLENYKEDAFCLKLSTLARGGHVIERIAKYLGVKECPKMRLTSHNPYSEKPNSRPAKHCDMLSDMCKKSDILYFEILSSHSLPSHLSRSLNITFHHPTKNEVLIRCISTVHHRTVSDLLNELKSEVQLFRPSAELRLLEIDHNRISKIYPLNEKLKNLKDQSWSLRAEEIPEVEKNLGLDNKVIPVCHFTRESLPGIRDKLDVRCFGEPFFLIIHKGETLAEIKLRIKTKVQVPDDEFSKWKFTHSGHTYFQDSDILFKHFRTIKDFYALDSTFFNEYLGLEHSHNFAKTNFATSQLEEDEMLVRHLEHVAGPQLIEMGQAQSHNTVKYQSVADPTPTKFTWTVENFSRLNNKEHYSHIFLVGCYKWRIMIFPKGNNMDHFSVYLNNAESSSLLYAEFSLVVVNQTHPQNSLRKDIRHQFTPGQSSGGIASFMPLSELSNPNRGYIVNDTCIIEAEMSLIIPIKKQKLGVPVMERLSKTVGVVEEASREALKVEQVPEPVMSNAGTTEETSTQSERVSSASEYPCAGQLYQEGKYSQHILDENFEDIGGFSILKIQASLYKQIWLKYGHIASRHVLAHSSYSVQVTLVTDIMTYIMDMCHCRLSDMSSSMVAKWESKIKMAETLEFNVKWLRKRFDVVKKVFNEYQKKTTALLEKDDALQAAEARFIYAENELKKARDSISLLEIERNVLGKGWPFTF